MLDIHMHSDHSDGSDDCASLVRKAKKAELKLISITDHDVIYVPSVDQLEGLHYLIGCEVSTFDSVLNKKIDLLLYGQHLITSQLNEILKKTNEARHHLSLQKISRLKDAGYQIQNVKSNAIEIIYKQHIMDTLIHAGYEENIYGELYKKLFKNGGILDEEINYPNIEKIINIAKEEGHLIVLAHPGLSDNLSQIERYVSLGLNAIETYHSSHQAELIKRCQAVAQKYHLIETGGSDHHGLYGNEPNVGSYPMEDTQRKALCKWIKSNLI